MNILRVAFHLTHMCNLNCDYCFTGEKVSKNMSDDMLRKAIAFTKLEVLRQDIARLEIIFFGGEPLLEIDKIRVLIEEFNRMPEHVNVSYKMSTNGTLLTEELARELLSKRVYISLSLDGNQQVHALHRSNFSGNSLYDKTLSSLKTLIKLNTATNVTCVVSPDTALQIAESVDFIYEQGCRFITTTLDYSARWTVEDMQNLKIGYEALSKWYERKMLSNEIFYLSFFDERIQTRTYKPLTKGEHCDLGVTQISIAPNGELYPCIQFVTTEGVPEYMIGHVDTGLDASCQEHISCTSKKPKSECNGCALSDRCSKWCSCINYMSTGRIDQVSPVLCNSEQMLLEIVDRCADRLWKKRNNMFIHKHYNPDYPLISHIELNL